MENRWGVKFVLESPRRRWMLESFKFGKLTF